jgi:hypothetical protein
MAKECCSFAELCACVHKLHILIANPKDDDTWRDQYQLYMSAIVQYSRVHATPPAEVFAKKE